MWPLWLGLAQAADDQQQAWLDLVLLATQHDGTGASSEELARRAAPLCNAGHTAACDLLPWAVPPDRAAAVVALRPACEAGDPVACLVGAWDHLRGQDPAPGFASVRQLCADGLQRACTEVGYAQEAGVGTYVQRSGAIETWTNACEAGERMACRELALASSEPERTTLLQRAADLGEANAHADLARDAQGEERVRRTIAACDLGLGTACRALARSEPNPLSRLEASCHAQSAPSCVLALVGSAEWGGRAVPNVITDLDALCARDADACLRSALLSSGAPPVTFLDGSWPHGEQKRLASDLRGALYPCYVDRITRSDVRGFVDVAVQVSAQGAIAGLALDGGFVDDTFRACSQAAAIGLRTRVPDGGSALVIVSVGLDHTSETKVHPRAGLDAPDDMTTLARSLDLIERDLDACAVGAGAVHVPTIDFDIVVSKPGHFESVVVRTSSESPEVDACVRDKLLASAPKPLDGKIKTVLTVALLQQRVPEEQRAAPIRPPPPPSSVVGGSLQWKVFAIVVRDNEIDGKSASAGPASVKSIREALDGVSAFVLKHTGGLVTLDADLIEVDGPLTVAFEKGAEGSTDRWVVDPEDLTLEIRDAVPAGYHGVIVWVPVPTGFPIPYYGYTSGSVNGATFSSAVIPDRAGIVVNTGVPVWFAPLATLYHQLRVRGHDQLGTYLPDSHEILRLPDGRVFNPRDWMAHEDAVDWYVWALEEGISPQLWADLLVSPP